MEKATVKYFLSSDKGKELCRLFDFVSDDKIEIDESLKGIYELSKDYMDVSTFEEFESYFWDIIDSIKVRLIELSNDSSVDYDKFMSSKITSWFDVFMAEFSYSVIVEEDDDNVKYDVCLPADKKRNIACHVPMLSLALAAYYPASEFFPVLFLHHYFEFVERCGIMGITLPKIPLQKDPEKRIAYYAEVCECLANFRDEHGLTNAQVCAILYGYAAEVREDSKSEVVKELPSPTRIWLTGASKDDVKNGLVDKDESVWACNEKTKVGDIVVLYALSPYSKIHSIWRAVADGNVNPFDYYCNRAIVGHRILTPELSFHDLKEDPEMGQVPVVRRGLIGINGVELTYQDYQILLRMLSDKGMDTSTLPNLEAPKVLSEDIKLKVEQDVSNNLLVPMLVRLGYSSKEKEDWHPELQLKAGRDKEVGEKGSLPRPDFTFFPKEEKAGIYTAPMLIECKYDMSSNNEFQAAFWQSVSYARLLQSEIMGVCDKYILRLYRKDKRGNISMDTPIFDAKWSEIDANSEVFNKLIKLIGRDTIAKMAVK